MGIDISKVVQATIVFTLQYPATADIFIYLSRNYCNRNYDPLQRDSNFYSHSEQQNFTSILETSYKYSV
jgi:hypothetical protein